MGSTPSSSIEDRLLALLRRLEYRGYDSAGLWTNRVGLVRSIEGIDSLARSANHRLAHANLSQEERQWGIAHTRWATHGMVSLRNTHPHSGCNRRVFVVHNGVIENAPDIRRQHPCSYRSETDTEVIAHLIEAYWSRGGTLEDATRAAVRSLSGSFAIAVTSPLAPESVVVARRESPLLVGVGSDWNAAASDVYALAPWVRQVAVLPEGAVWTLKAGEIWQQQRKLTNVPFEDLSLQQSEPLRPPISFLAKREEALGREIAESPNAWQQAGFQMLQRVQEDEQLRRLLVTPAAVVWISAACGSARIAAAIAARWFFAGGDLFLTPPARDVPFLLQHCAFPPRVVALSQSGETADTRSAVKAAQALGVPTIGIINVVPSSLAREVDILVPLAVGPETSVASTKAVVGQVSALVTLAAARSILRSGSGNLKDHATLLSEGAIQLEQFLTRQYQILSSIGSFLASCRSTFFIGNGAGDAVAREGALKLKEITYLPSEGLSAAELKHGPLAVVGEEVGVVALLLSQEDQDGVIQVAEVAARGAPVFVVAPPDQARAARSFARAVVELPDHPLAATACALSAAHCVAYEAARSLKRPVDRPRHLAKSVTVS